MPFRNCAWIRGVNRYDAMDRVPAFPGQAYGSAHALMVRRSRGAGRGLRLRCTSTPRLTDRAFDRIERILNRVLVTFTMPFAEYCETPEFRGSVEYLQAS